jgi:tripartite-type tricarboxylate transporter receptor subunit TctC
MAVVLCFSPRSSPAPQRVRRRRPNPTRPIRIVVPFPAGGGVDVFARAVAPALQAGFGQPVVIENIGGASSRLGTQAVLRALPDGYTLLITNDTLVTTEALPPRGASLPTPTR